MIKAASVRFYTTTASDYQHINTNTFLFILVSKIRHVEVYLKYDYLLLPHKICCSERQSTDQNVCQCICNKPDLPQWQQRIVITNFT